MDKAMSALVEDLAQRGLLQDTAVIWMGEFSRTPQSNGGAGRDQAPADARCRQAPADSGCSVRATSSVL